jgi:hypothetical protein
MEFRDLFRSPFYIITIVYLLTTVLSARAAIRGRLGFNSAGQIATSWYGWRSALAAFAVWNVFSYPMDTGLHNAMRAGAYVLLSWCVIQFGLFGVSLLIAKRTAERKSVPQGTGDKPGE